MKGFASLAAIFAFGMAYWFAVAAIDHVREPWDGAAYLLCWYPLSILLSGIAALVSGSSGWRPGVLITFAQLPVMLSLSGVGPLIGVGVIFLAVLSIPPMLASVAAGWAKSRLVAP